MKKKKFFPERELDKRFRLTKKLWNFFEKYYVSESFIEKHIDEIDDFGWLSISFHQSLSLDFILKYKDQLQFTRALIYNNQLKNFDLIKKYRNDLRWYDISKCSNLSSDFIDTFAEDLYWDDVCRNSSLSESLLTKYIHYLSWNAVSKHQKLSISFMETYAEYLDWELVSLKQKLNIKFIEKYSNLLDWRTLICRRSLRLSGKFLEKHMDKIEDNNLWDFVGRQKLEFWFIEKYQHKITRWAVILRDCEVPETVLENNKYKFKKSPHWFWIAVRQKISIDFIVRNVNMIDFNILRTNKNIDQNELNKKGIYVMATLCGRLA